MKKKYFTNSKNISIKVFKKFFFSDNSFQKGYWKKIVKVQNISKLVNECDVILLDKKNKKKNLASRKCDIVCVIKDAIRCE